MNVFQPIDLKPYCNHKLIYTQQPKGNEGDADEGIDGTYILEKDLKFKGEDCIDEIDFRFSWGRYDNVVCERQSIAIDAEATKLHVVGFAYWGDTNEYLKIIFDDLSEELVKVPFIDWSHKVYRSFQSATWFGKNITTPKIVISSGKSIHLIHFHHTVSELAGKKIKEIILPDNMFIHIFAITLENETLMKK